MKTFLALALVIGLLPLQAQDSSPNERIKNGDFADGTSHWEGDMKKADDLAGSDDAIPAGTKGIVIKLKPTEWTKFSQEVVVSDSNIGVSITLSHSNGTTFSEKQEDYENPPHSIGMIGFGFHGEQGTMHSFFRNVDVLTDRQRWNYKLQGLAPGTPKKIDFRYKVEAPKTRYILMFAFPPGHGVINITQVSILPAM